MKTELATLLDLPLEALDDRATLRGGLALDSLSMMRVVTWLESRGVSIAAEEDLPGTVGGLDRPVPDQDQTSLGPTHAVAGQVRVG